MLQEAIALLVTFMKRRQRLLIQTENVTNKEIYSCVLAPRLVFAKDENTTE
jgi:hypothetical protein